MTRHPIHAQEGHRHHADPMALFLAQDAITQFGAGIMLAGCSWYVLDQTHNNTAVAAANIANTVSGLLVSILGGSVSDRFSPRAVALWSHVVRTALTVLPAILLATGGFHLSFAVILMVSNGIGWNLYYPASKALIQRLTDAGTDGRQATKANSFAEISMQVGLFSSGAVAGTLYWAVGFLPVLVISAATFIVGLLLLAAVREPGHSNQEHGKGITASGNFWHTVSDGFRYLGRHPVFIAWCLILYTPFIIGNLNRTILPGYVQDTLGADSVYFGFIQSTWGVGACVAGITATPICRRFRTNRIIRAGLAGLLAVGIVLFTVHSIPTAFVMTFVAGFTDAVIRIAIYSYLMKVIPEGYFGRAISLMNAANLLIQTSMTQFSGMAMDRYGSETGYGFVAILVGLMILLAIRCPMRNVTTGNISKTA